MSLSTQLKQMGLKLKNLLTSLLILSFFAILCHAATDWTASSSCRWGYKFEEASGNFNDECTYNEDGIVTGTGYQSTGKYGYGFYLDGSDDEVDTTYYNDTDKWSDWTILAWVLEDDDWGIIASCWKTTSTSYQTYRLVINGSGGFYLAVRENSPRTEWIASSANDFNDAQYHHVAGVHDHATEIEIYVDGVSRAVDTNVASNLAGGNYQNSHHIGRYDESASGFMRATVDEVMFIRQYMTSTDINEAMDFGIDGTQAGPGGETFIPRIWIAKGQDVSGYEIKG